MVAFVQPALPIVTPAIVGRVVAGTGIAKATVAAGGSFGRGGGGRRQCVFATSLDPCGPPAMIEPDNAVFEHTRGAVCLAHSSGGSGFRSGERALIVRTSAA
jgi:hypothetical protein